MDLPPIEHHSTISRDNLSDAAQGLLIIIESQDEPLDFIEYLMHLERDDVLFDPFMELFDKGWIE